MRRPRLRFPWPRLLLLAVGAAVLGALWIAAPPRAMARAAEPQTMSLLQTLAAWQYPGTELLGGASMSDGGYPGTRIGPLPGGPDHPGPLRQGRRLLRGEIRETPGRRSGGEGRRPEVVRHAGQFGGPPGRGPGLRHGRRRHRHHGRGQPGRGREDDAHLLAALPTVREAVRPPRLNEGARADGRGPVPGGDGPRPSRNRSGRPPPTQVPNSGRRVESWDWRRWMMDECIWETRDSLRSSVAPISFMVSSS